MQRCIDSLQRSQHLADGLIDLAAGGQTIDTTCDIVEVVQGTLALMQPEMEQNAIKLTAHCDMNAAHIIGHADQLSQVIMNLVRNARHAFTDQAEPHIHVTVERVGDQIHVNVHDNGCGMTESVRKRVFDPFFSTRHATTGTGLGLAVCEAVVSRCGGQISIFSTRGEGTTVSVCLELLTEEEALIPIARHRILVVEDEPILRN